MRVPRYEPRYKLIRDEKSFDHQSFVRDVSQLPFSLVYSIEDPDEKLTIFNQLLLEAINKHAPSKKTKVTRPTAPWIHDPEIRHLQKIRDECRVEARQKQAVGDISRYSPLWEKFRESKRTVKKAVRKAKASFYHKALSKQNKKEVWKVIHSVLHPPAKRSTLSPSVLNKYFATVANKTLNKKAVPVAETKQFINGLPNNDKVSFSLYQTTYDEVLKQLKLIRNDLSTGPDEIPMRYIKLVDDVICSPLTHIINAFIEDNSFPSLWKIARVVPINKVPSPTESSHYRPIAILPALSKIFERIVCNQVIDFIERLKIYKDTLTGFRRGFSTGSALLRLRDDVKRAMNAGEILIIVLIDFSKAFDTISHDTLIRSLHKMGFSRDFLSWSLSYLSNRKQYVQIDAKQSKPMTTYFGLPQGSILGPLFFNLYVNGLQDSLASRQIQYADDTTIYESGKPNDIQMTTDKLNSSLENLEQWSN